MAKGESRRKMVSRLSWRSGAHEFSISGGVKRRPLHAERQVYEMDVNGLLLPPLLVARDR